MNAPSDIPRPPRLPRPMPDPPEMGWWVSPGLDPRLVRYHDGQDWTDFVCQLGLRGPGKVERRPISAHRETAGPDPDVESLPSPVRSPERLPTPPRPGWFRARDGRDPRLVRYHDGEDWTDFVYLRGVLEPGPVFRKPLPVWEPPQPTGHPEIDRLPMPKRFPDRISEGDPPGWYVDPLQTGHLKGMLTIDTSIAPFDRRTLRYYERGWTEFVCDIGPDGLGPVRRSPVKEGLLGYRKA